MEEQGIPEPQPGEKRYIPVPQPPAQNPQPQPNFPPQNPQPQRRQPPIQQGAVPSGQTPPQQTYYQAPARPIQQNYYQQPQVSQPRVVKKSPLPFIILAAVVAILIIGAVLLFAGKSETTDSIKTETTPIKTITPQDKTAEASETGPTDTNVQASSAVAANKTNTTDKIPAKETAVDNETIKETIPSYDPAANTVKAILEVDDTEINVPIAGIYGVNMTGPQFTMIVGLMYGSQGECSEWKTVDTNDLVRQIYAVKQSDCKASSFSEAGKYTYKVEVYDCSSVPENRSCSSPVDWAQPIATAEKTITISAPVKHTADIIFDIDRTTIKTNESFEGTATVRSLDQQFTARIVQKRWEDGSNESFRTSEQAMLGQDDRTSGIEQVDITLKAFGDTNESYSFELEKFPSEGTYHFSIKVYDCDDIHEKLGSPAYCAEDDATLEGVEPIAEEETSITATQP